MFQQASKMREVAEKVQEDKDIQESVLLMEKVRSSSNQGLTTLVYNNNISSYTYELFKRLGYTIDVEDDSTSITW